MKVYHINIQFDIFEQFIDKCVTWILIYCLNIRQFFNKPVTNQQRQMPGVQTALQLRGQCRSGVSLVINKMHLRASNLCHAGAFRNHIVEQELRFAFKCSVFKTFVSRFCVSDSTPAVDNTHPGTISAIVTDPFTLSVYVFFLTYNNTTQGREDNFFFFDCSSIFCFLFIEFHYTFSFFNKILCLLLLYFDQDVIGRRDSFFSCPLCFFPNSRLPSCRLRLFLIYLISFFNCCSHARVFEKHSCMSSPCPIAMLNGTFFFREAKQSLLWPKLLLSEFNHTTTSIIIQIAHFPFRKNAEFQYIESQEIKQSIFIV